MKQTHLTIRTALIGLAALTFAIPASAQTWVRYQARPIGSKVKIEGTSTLHDWTVDGKLIGGFMELDSNFPLDPAAKPAGNAKLNAKVEVNIPLTSLLSGKKLMDEVMWDAMKQRQYPQIQYKLKEISLKPNAGSGPLQFDSVGELAVSGLAKTINMAVTIERLDQNRLKVTGSLPMKMTTFGIKPPSPNIGLGLIKTGDDVKVSIEWLVAKATDASKPAEKN
ncbi:MAG: YceI family protein [Verrucomicrobia bacterium]|nr:YceI family protein [Verrucomicrobiota bacterium]